MRTFILTILAGALFSCGSSGSVRDSGASGSDWKDTGTSADDFVKSAIKAEQDFAKVQQTYREAFLYVSMLVTHTRDAVGKDRHSALLFAESVGSQFQTPDQLSANFLAQQTEIKSIVNSDGEILRALRDFALDMPTMKATLTQLNETSKNLMEKGPAVRESVAKETTDQAILTTVQAKVGQKTESLTAIHSKTPALLRQVTQMIDAINQASMALQ